MRVLDCLAGGAAAGLVIRCGGALSAARPKRARPLRPERLLAMSRLQGQGGAAGKILRPIRSRSRAFSAFVRTSMAHAAVHGGDAAQTTTSRIFYAYLQSVPKPADYKTIRC